MRKRVKPAACGIDRGTHLAKFLGAQIGCQLKRAGVDDQGVKLAAVQKKSRRIETPPLSLTWHDAKGWHLRLKQLDFYGKLP